MEENWESSKIMCCKDLGNLLKANTLGRAKEVKVINTGKLLSFPISGDGVSVASDDDNITR